jgi:hypothetical protein
VAPVELKLLRRVDGAFGNDGRAVAPVEVDAFDRAVVAAERAHVGPVEVPGVGVDRDAVRQVAARGDDLLVGTVGADREHTALGKVEDEETTGYGHARLALSWDDRSLSSVRRNVAGRSGQKVDVRGQLRLRRGPTLRRMLRRCPGAAGSR